MGFKEFMSYMQDRSQRRELIGGALCFTAAMALGYVFIVIFG